MYSIWLSVLVLGPGLLGFSTGGVPMRGEQGKEGAGCDDGTGALAGHLREGAQGMTVGIAVTAKRVLRFLLSVGCSDMCVFCFRTMAA